MKISKIVADSHSERIVSQICYLGPRHYCMKCRKLGCKK